MLREDPPLLVWAFRRAGRRIAFSRDADSAQDAAAPFRSVTDVADWFAEHGLDVCSGPRANTRPGIATKRSKFCVERVIAAAAAAESARQRMLGQSQAEQDWAELCGLLHGAEAWLPGSEFAAVVEKKVGWVERSEPHHEMPERIAEIGQRWQAAVSGPADWLPQLAAKMARLAALEQTFAETLQDEKLAALAEFAAGAGHEINNPLTVIAGRAQLFLREETDPERRRALALINAQAMRVHEMIADLRLFARPPRPELQPVELVELVDRLIAELTAQRPSKHRRLPRGRPRPAPIKADPTQLLVALRALCQNAIEALGAEGRIVVQLRRVPAASRFA